MVNNAAWIKTPKSKLEVDSAPDYKAEKGEVVVKVKLSTQLGCDSIESLITEHRLEEVGSRKRMMLTNSNFLSPKVHAVSIQPVDWKVSEFPQLLHARKLILRLFGRFANTTFSSKNILSSSVPMSLVLSRKLEKAYLTFQ